MPAHSLHRLASAPSGTGQKTRGNSRTGRPGPPFSWWPLARPQQPCPRSRTRSRAPQHAPSHRPALMRARAPAHMPARAPDSVLPCCMRPSPCPSRAHVPHPARFARPASMRPGGLGSSSPASAAHRSLRDRRENHLNSTTIKPGLHFGKPGRFHTSRAITPSAGSQGSKRFAQRCNLSSDIKGAACATGRALPPLAQSQLAGIPRFEAVCVRGVRHPLPQGEWHAAPSYTWGGKRLNTSTKRVSSGGLPSYAEVVATARLDAYRRRLAPL